MNEQRIREIADTAFKAPFGEVKVVRVKVRPRFDHDDPMGDVNLIYYGKYEQLTPASLLGVRSEVIVKAWRQVDDDLGFPLVHFIAKSDIGRRTRRRCEAVCTGIVGVSPASVVLL